MKILLIIGQVILFTIAGILLLAFFPVLLSRILDPLNIRTIRKHFKNLGISEPDIKIFPSHYGVRFMKNGNKCYVKCRVVFGKIKWKGLSPEEM